MLAALVWLLVALALAGIPYLVLSPKSPLKGNQSMNESRPVSEWSLIFEGDTTGNGIDDTAVYQKAADGSQIVLRRTQDLSVSSATFVNQATKICLSLGGLNYSYTRDFSQMPIPSNETYVTEIAEKSGSCTLTRSIHARVPPRGGSALQVIDILPASVQPHVDSIIYHPRPTTVVWECGLILWRLDNVCRDEIYDLGYTIHLDPSWLDLSLDSNPNRLEGTFRTLLKLFGASPQIIEKGDGKDKGSERVSRTRYWSWDLDADGNPEAKFVNVTYDNPKKLFPHGTESISIELDGDDRVEYNRTREYHDDVKGNRYYHNDRQIWHYSQSRHRGTIEDRNANGVPDRKTDIEERDGCELIVYSEDQNDDGSWDRQSRILDFGSMTVSGVDIEGNARFGQWHITIPENRTYYDLWDSTGDGIPEILKRYDGSKNQGLMEFDADGDLRPDIYEEDLDGDAEFDMKGMYNTSQPRWPCLDQWLEYLAKINQNACGQSTRHNVPALAKVAYIFLPSHTHSGDIRERILEADSYREFLEANGYSCDLVPMIAVLSTVLSRYDLVIIGSDTGAGYDWGDKNLVSILDGCGKPILGVGEGGFSFFGQLKLATGYPHGTFGKENSIYVCDPSHRVFVGPNQIVISNDRIVRLYDSADSVAAILRALSSSFSVLGSSASSLHRYHYLLTLDQGRYAFWGFDTRLESATDVGRDLFLNMVSYLISQAKPTP